MEAAEAKRLFGRIAANIESVMRGQHAAVRRLLAAFAGGGHVLIEDTPGTGKTTLAKTLAAIWGASFLFIRIAAPVFGVIATADVRMLIAGTALAAYYLVTGFDAQWRRWWRYYLAIGALNSVLPFLLYGYAALDLTVGLLAVLNATSPMWGALLSAVVLRERMSAGRIAGLLVGVGRLTRPAAREPCPGWRRVCSRA